MAARVRAHHLRRFDWIAASLAFCMSVPSGYLVTRFALPERMSPLRELDFKQQRIVVGRFCIVIDAA